MTCTCTSNSYTGQCKHQVRPGRFSKAKIALMTKEKEIKARCALIYRISKLEGEWAQPERLRDNVEELLELLK